MKPIYFILLAALLFACNPDDGLEPLAIDTQLNGKYNETEWYLNNTNATSAVVTIEKDGDLYHIKRDIEYPDATNSFSETDTYRMVDDQLLDAGKIIEWSFAADGTLYFDWLQGAPHDRWILERID